MAARRAVRRIRKADEFSLEKLAAVLMPPTDSSSGVFTWTLEQIRAARDDQLRGQFRQPVRMAAAMRTDDALYTAYENRLDPQRCIDVELAPAKTGRTADAERIASEADALYGSRGVGVTVDTMADINGDLANHGIAIGYNVPMVRDDGSRVDLEMTHWPLDAVREDPTTRRLTTRVAPMAGAPYRTETIVHGDGRWTVFKKHSCRPWQQEACILPASLIWARHAQGVRDWMAGSTSHGNSKVVGTLPDGMAITNKDGTPTREASEMMLLMRALMRQGTPYGLMAFGAELDVLSDPSRAWQVWQELVTNAEKSAARVYLGTDGILGTQGGAPGVDITKLFGVATTKVQGDLRCIERMFREGVLEPWCAINFGDSSLAPTRRYMIPDADADAVREQIGKRWADFNATISALRTNGFTIDQELVDNIAEDLGIKSPRIATARGEIFAYDIQLGVVTLNEVRERKGFPDREGFDVTVPERDAALAAATTTENGSAANLRRLGS